MYQDVEKAKSNYGTACEKIMQAETEDEQAKGAKTGVYKRIRERLNRHLIQRKDVGYQIVIALQPGAAEQL